MKLIVDASVALKWFLPDEPWADRAIRLLETDGELLAPEWIVPEVCNAVWKMVRNGRLSGERGEHIVSLLPSFFVRLVPVVNEAPRAMAIALTINHPVYDCFYVALAEREHVPLVTADNRLIARLAGTPWEQLLVSLGLDKGIH